MKNLSTNSNKNVSIIDFNTFIEYPTFVRKSKLKGELIMKTWMTPEISELNINETANGIIDSYFETLIVLNDDKKPTTPVEDPS